MTRTPIPNCTIGLVSAMLTSYAGLLEHVKAGEHDRSHDTHTAEAVIDFAGMGEAGPFPIKAGRIGLPQVTLDDLRDRLVSLQPAERVPDGWSSAVSDALAVIKDVAQFHGQLPIGVYQHIQPRLAALLAAAPSPRGAS